MRRTLSLLGILSAMFTAFPALAALPGLLQESASCTTTAGADAAFCSIDTMKQWQRDHYNFHDEERQEHTAWHLENDPKGVTPENLKAHRDYHEQTKRVHTVFHDRQKMKEKQFESAQSKKRARATNVVRTVRPYPESGRMAEGLRACAKYKTEQGNRSCMKAYLRPTDIYGRTVR